MAELVYAQHLKCCAARHAGSTPAPSTINQNMKQNPSGLSKLLPPWVRWIVKAIEEAQQQAIGRSINFQPQTFSQSSAKLNRKKSYLQVALNSTLDEAEKIIYQLPQSDRIIIEAGTPLIKRHGVDGIARLRAAYQAHLAGTGIFPYVVADLKTMDRGATEVQLAAEGGASGAIALGSAPAETLNAFISACEARGLDAMIDMMHVEFPLSVLRALKKKPAVVILHRGVDEEQFNREKQIPLHEIRRLKGNYDVMIAIAGGDTIREVQRSIFNDADIVVVWKSFFQSTAETGKLAVEFLKQIK